jgi:polynucleotide 5'-kinase involved in rRNA processing
MYIETLVPFIAAPCVRYYSPRERERRERERERERERGREIKGKQNRRVRNKSERHASA